MYIPDHFRESRTEVIGDLIRANSFGTLVSVVDGVPFATHLPFLLDSERGPNGTLVGHMARANPHWRAFEAGGDGARVEPTAESLVTFLGPHAYVSPSWYVAPVAVPTWNYAAVHVYGRPRILEDEAAVRGVLARTVNNYESAFERPWTIDDIPGDVVERMAENVVAFELAITRIEGKLKLTQNRSAADRRGVVEALERLGEPDGVAVAGLMDLHFPSEA
jgi:transcriptional regulator